MPLRSQMLDIEQNETVWIVSFSPQNLLPKTPASSPEKRIRPKKTPHLDYNMPEIETKRERAKQKHMVFEAIVKSDSLCLAEIRLR